MTRLGRALGVLLAVASVVALAVPVVAEAGPTSAPAGVVTLRADPASVVPRLETGWLSVPDLGSGAHRVRVGVVPARGAEVAEVLFLHGHADRLDNHPALFDELSRAGVRVVSFDLPSHGLTDAGPIDVWSFDDLSELAARVAAATSTEDDTPFVLAGWSFGGLLATRIAQSADLLAAFDRPVSGLALEVPALAPYPAAGGDGVSRLRALTHDRSAPVAGPPSPASPLLDPLFAGRLLVEAELASARPLPADIPALVELSDPADDLYVDTAAVARWAMGRAAAAGADVTVRTCAGARHGLDFEAYPLGPAARADLVDFVRAAAEGRPVIEDRPSTHSSTTQDPAVQKEVAPCR